MASPIKPKNLITTLTALCALALDARASHDMLFSGETLATGDYLENKPYKLMMQDDCNLVLYMNETKKLWSSGSDGKAQACQATLRDDGNLVVMSGQSAVWSSGSASQNPAEYRLVVQSDGNVAIYGPPIWSSLETQPVENNPVLGTHKRVSSKKKADKHISKVKV
ncbi:hypothetical protein J5N97_029069 [Dioscorea zingiberensis]|uniref:Bulb-type lectin domain-containing protein n=1 Tax=Dioscorea zingiberensis TaxID=325984 RepID=A0A9D5H5J7_9LILI|nr:hypothetical protein J5N97_029069 [Dioscorea zingiberensis]